MKGNRYKIDCSLFADDGIYRLTIHLQDAAGNMVENSLNTKNAEISFGVDKTLPLINVFNLESGMTYVMENITAEFSASGNHGNCTGTPDSGSDYNRSRVY